MSLYRNLTEVPLETGLEGGLQILPGDNIELTKEEISLPLVAQHLQQGALAPVTMAAVASTSKARTPDQG